MYSVHQVNFNTCTILLETSRSVTVLRFMSLKALFSLAAALPLVRKATPYAVYRTKLFLPHYRTMSSVDEVSAAQASASTDPAINPNAPTFFDKLVSKQIPANIIYEDDLCMAFRDINPQGPVHFLVIPKDKDGLNKLSNAREDQKAILGHLMYTAQKVAKDEGLADGFRVVINDGANGAQSVYHLHLHVIGGRQMKWPPG